MRTFCADLPVIVDWTSHLISRHRHSVAQLKYFLSIHSIRSFYEDLVAAIVFMPADNASIAMAEMVYVSEGPKVQ